MGSDIAVELDEKGGEEDDLEDDMRCDRKVVVNVHPANVGGRQADQKRRQTEEGDPK